MNKITIESLLVKIHDVRYILLDDGRTTLCQLTLENGYTVLGTYSVVDKSEFNLDRSQQIAFNDATRQIWPLEGYLLAEKKYLDKKILESLASPDTKLTEPL